MIEFEMSVPYKLRRNYKKLFEENQDFNDSDDNQDDEELRVLRRRAKKKFENQSPMVFDNLLDEAIMSTRQRSFRKSNQVRRKTINRLGMTS